MITTGLLLQIYNHGQQCLEGSVTLEITPSPLKVLDFPRNKMVTFLPTLNMGEGGHKRMLFLNSTANSYNRIRCEVK